LWLINHTLWAQTEAGKKFIGGQMQIQTTSNHFCSQQVLYPYWGGKEVLCIPSGQFKLFTGKN
jgi:hypothetical protein